MVFIGGTEGRDVFTVLPTRFGEKERGYSIVVVVTGIPFCMTVTPTQHNRLVQNVLLVCCPTICRCNMLDPAQLN